MLLEVIRFEWRYHTRQVAFPVGVLFFFGMGFVLPVLGYGPPGTHLNSPFVVMQSVGLLSLLTVFVLSVFCANAVARDAEHGMKEIVYATSVGKLRYLTARFAGAFAAALTVFSFTVVGLYLAPLVGDVDPAKLGDPSPAAYLWALLVLALPNMLFAGAVVFALAVLTRSVLASYVGSVFLYMLYLVIAMMIDSPLMAGSTPQSPQVMALAAVIDPFGISAFFQQTWYWTPAQRDTQLLALDGYFTAMEPALAFPDTGDIRADLTTQLHTFVGALRDTPAGRVIAELIGQAQVDPDLAAAYRERYSGPRRALAVTALRRAQDRGQLRPDVDPEAVVDQLWGACYHRLLLPDQPLTAEFADALVANLFDGVR